MNNLLKRILFRNQQWIKKLKLFNPKPSNMIYPEHNAFTKASYIIPALISEKLI